jgi:hypothetical protein
VTQPEEGEGAVTLEVVGQRPISVEIRSAVAWLTWIFGTVAWAFGFIDGKAAGAALLAGALVGISTYQPKR